MTGKRVVDFGLYILIGLAIAIGAMLYAFRSPSAEGVQLVMKWVSLLAGTAIVFGLYIRRADRYRAARSWRTTLGLLTVHFAIFVAVIYFWPGLKLIWLFLFMWAESVALSMLLPDSGRRS